MATINPNTWLSLDLSKKGQEQTFIKQLVQYLTNQFTPANLAAILNGSASLTAAAMLANTAELGPQSGNFTFNCQGAALSVFTFQFSSNLTLTLSNFPIGAQVFFTATLTGGSNETLKMAASTPSGTAYTTITLDYYSNATNRVNMISSGLTIDTTQPFVMFSGASVAGPLLNLIGQ
jgi:hypothetical protein